MKYKSIIFVTILASISVFPQDFNPFHQTLVDQVNNDNIQSSLEEFIGFGEKSMGSSAQENAMDWIIDLYESWGYTEIQQQSVETWGNTGYNLIITKTGTVYPDKFIILDGHYDTINGPGANDNGSGTSIILEIARILKDIPTEYSIKFIHFTAEELGLVGSSHYVNEIVIPENLDIELVFNIDQVGGISGQANTHITCERDEDGSNSNDQASEVVTNQLATLMELYADLETNISYAYGSDYVPFQEAGYVITGLYESNESPFTHSPDDIIENMDPDYVYQIAKGTMGAICFFAKAYDELSLEEISKKEVVVYPNPVDNQFNIKSVPSKYSKFQLTDSSGKIIVYGNLFNPSSEINTTNLPEGVYILKLTGKKENYSQKIIVKHK